jgi:hypothetical protein
MCYCQANRELCSSRVQSFLLQKLDCNFAQNKKTICGVESDPFAFQTLGSSSPLTRNLQRKTYLRLFIIFSSIATVKEMNIQISIYKVIELKCEIRRHITRKKSTCRRKLIAFLQVLMSGGKRTIAVIFCVAVRYSGHTSTGQIATFGPVPITEKSKFSVD